MDIWGYFSLMNELKHRDTCSCSWLCIPVQNRQITKLQRLKHRSSSTMLREVWYFFCCSSGRPLQTEQCLTTQKHTFNTTQQRLCSDPVLLSAPSLIHSLTLLTWSPFDWAPFRLWCAQHKPRLLTRSSRSHTCGCPESWWDALLCSALWWSSPPR